MSAKRFSRRIRRPYRFRPGGEIGLHPDASSYEEAHPNEASLQLRVRGGNSPIVEGDALLHGQAKRLQAGKFAHEPEAGAAARQVNNLSRIHADLRETDLISVRVE